MFKVRREYGMIKNTKKLALICMCFTLVLSGLNVSAFAQDKTKLYTEIAGEYEYNLEGQSIIIIYTVEDGKLYGTEETSPEPPTLLEPVEGQELAFTATGDDGNLYEISFSRDEDGKITKSILATQGIEIEGVKIK
jgi:hypothetical protein